MAKYRNSGTSNTRALVARPIASMGATPFVSPGRMIDDDMPQILGWGIDTLYLSFDVHVGDQTWKRLEEERGNSPSARGYEPYCPCAGMVERHHATAWRQGWLSLPH